MSRFLFGLLRLMSSIVSVSANYTDMPPARKAVGSDKKRSGGIDMERNDARRS